MVEIRIWVEGASLEHEKASVQMMDNSQVFREAFRKLFSRAFSEYDLSIIIENGGPNLQTVNFFKSKVVDFPGTLLLIDLDAPASERGTRLTEFDLLDFSAKVFFMVQAMEAWILSQPDKIEQHFANFRCKNGRIEDDNKISGIHPENILHPADALNTILARYFQETKNGKTKKIKYHKLRTGPALIELLDFEKLISTFEDVAQLNETIIEYVRPNGEA